MKTRNGFVSNSSSSSFVIVASQEVIDKALKTLSEPGRELINETYLYGTETPVINGKSTVVAYGVVNSESIDCSMYDDDNKDAYEQADEDMESFVAAVRANGGFVSRN
jgi:hypothetical protein